MSMRKFWGIVYNMIDNADVALEVVDARFPSICRSNQLEKYVNNSSTCNLVIALNKSDLLPREHTDAWIEWFAQQNITAIAVSATKRLGTSRIRQVILRASKRKTAVVAVVGFPNTGKSSLINTLRGKAAAGVAPIPGKTRGEQKVKVSNSLYMFDTPGVIPIKLPEKHKLLLGLTAITKIKDLDVAADHFYEMSMEISPGYIAEFYGVDSDPAHFLENLARVHNKLIKGGEPDIHMAARILLTDHVKGKFAFYESVNQPLRLGY